MEQALRGRLGSFKLYDVLTFLNMSQKTGTLSVVSREGDAAIFFERGEVRFATSRDPRFRLGTILLRRNRLTPSEIATVESSLREQPDRFGQAVVRQGLITADELSAFLKIQVSEIIYDCFGWGDGEFMFSETMNLPEHAVTIAIDISNLIMEGARRIEEWDQCLKLLPDSSVVFRVIDNPEIQERISLSLREWQILFRIDGEKTLADIVKEAEQPKLALYKTIYGLLASKLIEVVPDEALKVTYRQAASEFVELPAPEDNRTSRIPDEAVALLQISDEEWKEIEDDTSLLVSESATLSFKDVMKVAVTAAKLTVTEANGDRRMYPLVESRYTIGRLPDSTIHLTDSGVSGNHAVISRTAEGYIIEDLKSRNGTYVNGKLIQRHLLEDDDILRIGRTHLHYMIVHEVPAAVSR